MCVKAFPFDPNPDWSRFYSSGAEIEDYIVRTAGKWNLDRDVKLEHEVVEARWLEDEGQWRLNVQHHGQEQIHYADILLSGQGVLVYVCPAGSSYCADCLLTYYIMADTTNGQRYQV